MAKLKHHKATLAVRKESLYAFFSYITNYCILPFFVIYEESSSVFNSTKVCVLSEQSKAGSTQAPTGVTTIICCLDWGGRCPVMSVSCSNHTLAPVLFKQFAARCVRYLHTDLSAAEASSSCTLILTVRTNRKFRVARVNLILVSTLFLLTRR